ncbi:MAG: radical SAM protein [Acidobacteriota bacterium]
MIGITKLYCGESAGGDVLRYGDSEEAAKRLADSHTLPESAGKRKPVVVWNITRRCNLRCIHCYTDSENISYSGELNTEEARALIDDLAQFSIPALLFSGGEPLMRKDLFDLVKYARSSGIRPVLSTNGTLIDERVAEKLKDSGFIYVGISLDGIEMANDRFRGVEGAFSKAVRGFRNCVNIGQKVGLRLTLTRQNFCDLNGIFDFIEEENINRACFYHLVYSGRGTSMLEDDLTHGQSREAMDIIIERTADFCRRGLNREILTVDNHCDGVYLYFKLREEDPERAEKVMKLLKWNGGGTYSSGVGIGCIDFLGNVHPDQFWMSYTLGNVRDRKFSEIWMDVGDPLMAGLKNRKGILKGRCGKCIWKDACGGSMRARAYAIYKDPWMEDPACYLTDEEIGIK